MFKKLKSLIKNSVTYVKFKERKKAYRRKKELSKYLGEDYTCPVCGAQLSNFKPIWKSYFKKAKKMGYVYPFSSMETFNFNAFSCPSCDAADKERLYALYLDNVLESLDKAKNYRFIDFAPSIGLQNKLKNYPFLEYRSADLVRKTADDQVDITDMHPYTDNSVDIFLCSHILEHVPNDRKALKELHRILRPDGFGIIMVPIIHGLEQTHEDPSINTPALRWKFYGQDDHVRQYGKSDFLNRLDEAGFIVKQYDVSYFGKEKFQKAGIAEDSILYVVGKAL